MEAIQHTQDTVNASHHIADATAAVLPSSGFGSRKKPVAFKRKNLPVAQVYNLQNVSKRSEKVGAKTQPAKTINFSRFLKKNPTDDPFVRRLSQLA